MKNLQIGVMGPSKNNYPAEAELARRVEEYSEIIGGLLAREEVLVFTGGDDGIMEAVMRGAKNKGGTTIGFPGTVKSKTNPFCDIRINLDVDIGSFAYAGMPSSNALITFPIASSGTMLEIMSAYRHRIPNVLLRGFNPEFEKMYPRYYDATKMILFYWVKTPEEAVDLSIELGGRNLWK
ncbi:hypothetical protein COU54_02770 [Candidatus Pacearchaeota archaeon CG10_big_fil_rev_8_21_14_0_10_31_24]|nr:MAG: hypothetical protein COU54_02770 [Candidatus Pacearchaeota archaeon CG10_big_fil_rev_8_21_14_0_10_31_24]